MKKRISLQIYLFLCIALFAGILGAYSCSDEADDPNDRNSSLQSSNKGDMPETSSSGVAEAICAKLGLPINCDLCGYYGWYEDGNCDNWLMTVKVCKKWDLDCGPEPQDPSKETGEDAGTNPGKEPTQSEECGNITNIGCCIDDTHSQYCDNNGKLVIKDCSQNTKYKQCGWYAAKGFYTCTDNLNSDLSGENPRLCSQVSTKESNENLNVDQPKDFVVPESCSAPWISPTNSGKVCNLDDDTPCSKGEVCASFKAGSNVGMCVGLCCPDPAKTINFCSMASTMQESSSLCLKKFDETDPQTLHACVWECSFKNSKGEIVTKKCPDEEHYDCLPFNDPANPDIKICVPKEQRMKEVKLQHL